MKKYSFIILFSLLSTIGLTQEKHFHIDTVKMNIDPVSYTNDSLQQELYNRINQIVKEINHEIFTHNFSNDTLFCPAFKGSVVMLYTFTLNNDQIGKYEVVSTSNCERFNHLLTSKIMKLEGEYLHFNEYENNFRLIVTIHKTIGWIDFFEIY
jgi:hypothetical protein